jgi:hypothetical protein
VLIERDQEVDRLLELLADAVAGEGRWSSSVAKPGSENVIDVRRRGGSAH